MNKPKPIQINIPNPCSKSWDEMMPSGNGRHCVHCDKVVTDFTKWTDKQLFDHFSQNINRHVCGRFTAMQVNRPILPTPQPHSKLYRLFIGLGLTLLLTQIPTEQASSKTPFVSCYDRYVVNENEQEVTGSDSIRITGKVVNEKGKPLSGAIAFIEHNRKILDSASTDIYGHFSMTISKTQAEQHNVVLGCDYRGYQDIVLGLDSINISGMVNLKMEPNSYDFEGIIIESPSELYERSKPDTTIWKGRIDPNHPGKKDR